MNTLGDAATERVLTTLLEKMPLIGVCLDTHGIVTYVNPFFLTVTGFTQEEVIGKNWFAAFIPETIRTMLTSSFQDILTKNANTRFENPILTKSGEGRLISWTNVLLTDADGKSVGTLSIGEDVTDLKRAEESLLESEENFRILSQIAQEGIVIHDKGIILLCNQKLADMSGYAMSEIVGNNVMMLFPPQSQDSVKEHMNDDVGACYRVTGQRKDGMLVPVEICSKFVVYHGIRARVATIQEI